MVAPFPCVVASRKVGKEQKNSAGQTVRIGLVQMQCSDDPDANLDKAVARVQEAAKKGAKIICLQELFRSQYFCQEEDATHFDLAEPIPGPSTQRLTKVAKKLGVVIVASLFERRTQGLYHNTAVVIDADGTILGKYRKMHIPDDPRFYEKFYFAPGDLGFQAFSTRYGKIGVLVCWDQWYPEAARLTALRGAQILFYPTAIGTWVGEKEFQTAQHDAWETVQRSHAVTNGVFVAAPNRIGREGELVFWGKSFVASPFGQVVARASDSTEEILVVDCDLSDIERFRRGWPFLRDRRIDAYGPLTERYLGE
jgi:N-carbamoylputrescine amidase